MNAYQDVFLLFVRRVAYVSVLPKQIELRHRQRGEVGQYDLDALGAAALGPMKLIHTELPDSQRLKHGALATVVAPDQQIKPCEVIDLFTNALEVAQGQSGNHSGTPLWLAIVTFSGFLLISHHPIQEVVSLCVARPVLNVTGIIQHKTFDDVLPNYCR